MAEITEEEMEEMELPPILPCPFCGNSWSPTYWKPEGSVNQTIVCDVHSNGCGATGGYYGTKKEAIEAWNRRA